MTKKIERITLLPGPDAIRKNEVIGDLQVTALVQTSVDTLKACSAVIRDRVLGVFVHELVDQEDLRWRPVVGTVRGPQSVLQGVRTLGELPSGASVTFEPVPDYDQVIEKAMPILPPKLPPSVKAVAPDRSWPTDPKTHVRPDAPYAAFQPFDGGPVRDGQVIGADGTLFELPKDPIERFLDVLTPVIEKMAEMTAIPVQVQLVGEEAPKWVTELTGGVPLRPTDFSVSVPETAELSEKIDQMQSRRDRIMKAGSFSAAVSGGEDGRGVPAKPSVGRNKCEVADTDLGSAMGLRTSKDKLHRWVHIDITDDEFRELIIWHFREAMRNGSMSYMDASITSSAIKKIADDAFRRIFDEIRNEVVVTGRDVGTAL